MILKTWWQTKKSWLRGGIIGLIVCLILFVFNIFVYFPLLDTKYGGSLPGYTLIFPTVTGHFFPLFTDFIIPNNIFCKPTHTICTSWQAVYTVGGVPWQLESGEYGYCTYRSNVPDDSCTDYFGKVNFWAAMILLFAIYFAIGAFVGHFWEKRKSR